MRTAIFLGLTAIADAIRKNWLLPEVTRTALIILLIMMLMDILDFIKDQIKTYKDL